MDMPDPNSEPQDEPEIKQPDNPKPDFGQAQPEPEIGNPDPEQPEIKGPGEDLPN